MSILAEAQQILRAFEFDRKRTNALAGRTLMALAQVDTNTPWDQATTVTGSGSAASWTG